MRKVNPLTEAERVTLQEMHKRHPLSWTRHRAHAILLSGEGYRVVKIAQIYGVCRQTVASWLKAFATKRAPKAIRIANATTGSAVPAP